MGDVGDAIRREAARFGAQFPAGHSSRRDADDAAALLAAHELANGGCVPADAYRDLGEAHRELQTKIESLADEWASNDAGYGIPAPSWAFASHAIRAILEDARNA